ncbi:MAG: DMT family transporter [Amphritea sp.]
MNQYRGEPSVNPKGLMAMLITLLIWVGFLLSLRAENQSVLTSSDLALMRFGIPAMLFLPWFLKQWQQIRHIPWQFHLMIMLGGLPFFYLVSLGSQYAPAAHAGALVPGTAPLFVTALAVLIFKEPLSRSRLIGLGIILMGVTLLLGSALLNFSQGYWRGHLTFLGASLLWAFYTLGLRVAGISALQATALLCSSATIGLLLMLCFGWIESSAISTPWNELWPFLLTQGIGAGVIGGITYGIAISNLGAEKTAALGSFTPALAALVAIPLLGEQLTFSTITGVTVIMFGVLFASGIKWQRTSSHHTAVLKETSR